jgi:hypothetical protein
MRAAAFSVALMLLLAGALARGQEGIERRRPAGEPRRAPPPGVEAPAAPAPERPSLPVDDRWRILRMLELAPGSAWDPYNPNALKGDFPIAGGELAGWFLSLTALSDSLYELRRVPTPAGAQATQGPGASRPLADGRQSLLVQNIVVSAALIKGNTTFRPPDYELRVTPAISLNRARAEERRVLFANPAHGTERDDNFVGIQEAFVDRHLRDVSERYDFDSVRLGVQPFNADFRGFLFLDQPFGLRLFGTRDNNRWQYNAAWFRRLEKDTNSGFNDIMQKPREDDVFVLNVYRQDWPMLGFTSQAIVLHNRNREGARPIYVNANGFVERPSVLGSGRPHDYDVSYAGVNGEGHFGRWNASLSGYHAFGTDSRGMVSGRPERIAAWFGAAELSRDFSWVRVRASAAYASGDRDPHDGAAQGFDAVLENPSIAGADTSYWIRQSVPLVGGGGTALSIRNGMLASLRSSREHGQSNFTNPGLRLVGAGADLDLAPELRLILNANHLAFDNLSSLAALRNQRLSSADIGWDLSAGLQYRPFFTQNVVVNASFGVLLAGDGLRALYGDAVSGTQYSALFNVLLTF